MRRTVRLFALAALGLALVLGAAGLAGAGSIISNLPGNDTTLEGVYSATSPSFNSVAAGFIMPAGPDYSLDSVDLRLSFTTTSIIPVVSIYNNVVSSQVNQPGQILMTMNAPPILMGPIGDYLFSPPTPLTLQAGMIYWVVVGNGSSSPDSFDWAGSSPGITPSGVARSAGYRAGFGTPPPTTTLSMLTPSYGVNASISGTPEPATFGMLAIGIGAVASLMWRRRAVQPHHS